MEEMLTGGDSEARVGTGQVANSFPDGITGIEPPAFITVTRGVDVTFSTVVKTLSSVSHNSEDALSKQSIGPKASNESLLDNPFSSK